MALIDRKSVKRPKNYGAFSQMVFKKVKKIPRGRVTTYKQLARVIGRPKAFRAVGNTLNQNQLLIAIPCHRIVRLDGKIGGYRLGQKKKINLLRREGIEIEGNKIKNFKKYFYGF
jgi:methylated-DNA-[protein]-cysteine S-methyltransferase